MTAMFRCTNEAAKPCASPLKTPLRDTSKLARALPKPSEAPCCKYPSVLAALQRVSESPAEVSKLDAAALWLEDAIGTGLLVVHGREEVLAIVLVRAAWGCG